MTCVTYPVWTPEDHHAVWSWGSYDPEGTWCCIYHAQYFDSQLKPMSLSLSNKPELAELGIRWMKEERKAKRLGKAQEKLR